MALKLLCHCAGFCKMVFSIRAVPASFHAEALHAFDAQVCACFEQFTCLYPDDEQWMQATLPTASGGLGLQSIAKHSHAAFLASRRCLFELRSWTPLIPFCLETARNPLPSASPLALSTQVFTTMRASRLTHRTSCRKKCCR